MENILYFDNSTTYYTNVVNVNDKQQVFEFDANPPALIVMLIFVVLILKYPSSIIGLIQRRYYVITVLGSMHFSRGQTIIQKGVNATVAPTTIINLTR